MSRPKKNVDQSSEESHKYTKVPSDGNNQISSGNSPEDGGRWWERIDHSLFATIALTIISTCALFVSIYQTRVLSLQQEVMAEQQRIMTENAKAQLWPNVGIGRSRGYENGVISELDFSIGNTGTGPAIIERVTLQYQGKYARNWWELFNLTNLPDTIPQIITNSRISGRVLQSGEGSVFLSLSDNQPLMEHFARIIEEEQGITVTICYKSVFDDHWLLEAKLGEAGERAFPVETCSIADSSAFTY